MRTPFYSTPRGWLDLQAEMIDTTRPGDVYVTFAPTGQHRARLFRWVPVPWGVARAITKALAWAR